MSITSFARNKFFRADYYNEEILKKEYRALSIKYHPDTGGTQELFIALTNEYDFCLDFIKKNPPPPPPKPLNPIREIKIFRLLGVGPFHRVMVPMNAFRNGATIFCMVGSMEIRLDLKAGVEAPAVFFWNNHQFSVEVETDGFLFRENSGSMFNPYNFEKI